MKTPMHQFSRRSFLGLAGAAAGALALGACGEDEAPPAADGPQTVKWWHIQNGPPLKAVWEKFAKSYQTANNKVTIEITDLENEAFKARLTTVTQAGDPPDLFQSWGGGVLQQQVDADLVQDLTEAVQPWIGNLIPAAVVPYTINDRIYGIPWDIGMVGMWYNKDLFERAGISEAPTTWTALLDVVTKLKAKNIVPIALAGKDKWPGHFWFSYLAIRIAGTAAMKAAYDSKNWENPDFVTAGQKLKELVALQPFQRGFAGAEYGSPDGQAAAVGNGDAAMELMGQWAPAVQKSSSKGEKGLGDKLGFFTFPTVEGGKGSATDAFGGGNGFAVGKDAPPATLDFLKFFLDVAQQREAAATGAVLPTNKAAADAIKDTNNQTVAQALTASTGLQLYLDQYFPPAVGTQVNDSVAELIAGVKEPDQILKDITAVAQDN
jgi:raffinose/stachyose/melibiose transport system substrate-binding protein